MMESHETALAELARHLKPVFEQSPDGVYLWLDEKHKVCNEQLATMFGYDVGEWQAVDDFAATFIAEESRSLYVWHYQHEVAELRYPVSFRFRGKRKDGSTFDAETDMIPLTYAGHVVAYHFVRQLGT
ncbi:PAS domain-containing protein [Sinomonas mesophila]|uniref:PAS domain-containing protein n=1 Tax=Sinomonas mesophila TaxID=1531955 RepID=UPI000985A033|nr:PAS domain-containing protein [Sinomonas mesophila]